MFKVIKKIFYKEDISESFLMSLLVFLKLKFTKISTKSEIKRRKDLSIFNYQELSIPLDYYPYHLISENDFYGNGVSLFEKFSYNYFKRIFTRIEHSVPYDNRIENFKTTDFAKEIIVLSEKRKLTYLGKTDKKIRVIGPYIQYVDSLLNNNEMDLIRGNLGKTLLVFPSHSIDNIYSIYDVNQFVNWINRNKTGFDTVLVCLYWKDIQLGKAEEYEKNGFKIVTAGHLYDYNFLKRLKSLILLADHTISNSVGSHVAYCISLKRSHYIFNSQINMETGNNIDAYKRQQDIISKNKKEYEVMKTEVKSAFSKNQYYISKEQINCIKKYWGDF